MTAQSAIEEYRTRLAQGAIDDAVAILEAGIFAYPQSQYLHEQLAVQAFRRRDFTTARRAYKRAKALGVSNGTLAVVEVDFLLLDDDFAAAARAAETAMAKYPDDEGVLRAAIRAHERSGDTGAADACWEALGRSAYLSCDELYRAASAARDAGNSQRAATLLSDVLARDPLHYAAIADRVALLLSEHDADLVQADTICASLAHIRPHDALSLLPAFLERQDYRLVLTVVAAVDEAQQFVSIDNDLITALLDHAFTELSAGHHVSACRLYTSLYHLTRTTGDFLPQATATFAQAISDIRADVAGMPQGAADAAIARVADIAATGPDVASRMAALADLADTIGAPVTAVELWFQLWRRNHADNSIARALEACEQMSSAYQALAFLTSHADPHAGDPGITKTGLRIARRVNAELQATEPTLDPELVLAARNLFVWHIATEAPVAGAKRLLQGLLKKMKEADVAGDVHGAIAHGEAALSIDPGNTFPLKVMARLYRVVGNDAGARQVLRRLVEAEPADMGLSLRYTRSCRAAGRMDDAIETLIENGMRQPGHIELYETLDDCLTDMNAR